jgi:uncharacterized membrane protein YkvA (DUF1232 family)
MTPSKLIVELVFVTSILALTYFVKRRKPASKWSHWVFGMTAFLYAVWAIGAAPDFYAVWFK